MLALVFLFAAADTKIVLEPVASSPLSAIETKQLEDALRKTTLPTKLRKRLTLVGKAANAPYAIQVALVKAGDAFNLTLTLSNQSKVVATVAKESNAPIREGPALIVELLTKAFGEATPELMFESEVKNNSVTEPKRRRQIGVIIGTDRDSAIAEALRADYGFTVNTLLGDQAKREGVIKRFKWLAEHTKADDDVLIYFSDVAVNANLHELCAAIPAKQVLILADSRFTNASFVGAGRQALSSSDVGFTPQVLKVLRENKAARLDTRGFYEALEKAGAKLTLQPAQIAGEPFVFERLPK